MLWKRHTKRTFKCLHCYFETLQAREWKFHLESHKRDTLKCTGLYRQQQETLVLSTSWRQSGNTLKSRPCEYYTIHSVTSHNHVHTQKDADVNYQYCDYRTKPNIYLKVNLNMHTDDMFKCLHCKNQAYISDALKTHLKNHNGYVLKCSHCDYKTVRPCYMRAHL